MLNGVFHINGGIGGLKRKSAVNGCSPSRVSLPMGYVTELPPQAIAEH